MKTLTALGTIDAPQRIDPGVTYRVALDSGESAFMALPGAVSGLVMMIDIRSSVSANANLQGELSILDADGAMVQPRVIAFNEIDYGYRRTGAIAFGRTPVTVRLKLSNGGRSNVYWFTAFTAPLKKGVYKVIVDLTNTPRDKRNIQAYEIDYAYRKVGALTVKQDGAGIFRFQLHSAPAAYSIRVVPDNPSP